MVHKIEVQGKVRKVRDTGEVVEFVSVVDYEFHLDTPPTVFDPQPEVSTLIIRRSRGRKGLQ